MNNLSEVFNCYRGGGQNCILTGTESWELFLTTHSIGLMNKAAVLKHTDLSSTGMQ